MHWIIRFVEDLKAILEPTGCSIEKAQRRRLGEMTREQLFKLREGAIDLHRSIDDELNARSVDAAEQALGVQ